MKQRTLITNTLAGKPKPILADEPTSVLDVTVQKVILDHLIGPREDLGPGILPVTHGLGVASDRVGEIIEADTHLIERDTGGAPVPPAKFRHNHTNH